MKTPDEAREQLAKLDGKLGEGRGAVKERARLQAIIDGKAPPTPKRRKPPEKRREKPAKAEKPAKKPKPVSLDAKIARSQRSRVEVVANEANRRERRFR